MTNKTTADGSSLTVALSGRLDTVTAPELEAGLKDSLEGIRELVLDLNELEYISSAGLRVLLAAHKSLTAEGGRMVIRGANDLVKEVFEVTGFTEILNLE